MFDARRTDDRRVHRVLMEQPRERDLCHRHDFFGSEFFDTLADTVSTVRPINVDPFGEPIVVHVLAARRVEEFLHDHDISEEFVG